jgi:hypothetical protein
MPCTLVIVLLLLLLVVVQDSNFKEVGQQVLQDFHDWVQVRGTWCEWVCRA